MTERPERLRLFVAVNVPAHVLEGIAEATLRLREQLPGARWSPLENQHVTLKFIGSIDAGRFSDVVQAVRAAAAPEPPSEIRVIGLGAFPSARRARVLWAGIDDPRATLTSVAGSLDSNLAPLGIAPEERSFTPHLTLARFKTPADVRAALASVDFSSEPFEISKVRIYRSRLSPKGARYEALEDLVLQGEETR